MTRTNRLLNLLQQLRSVKHPVRADTLARHLGISLRTVYRDIDTLRRQGAEIHGEPGMGFVLRKDLLLPPLMFDENEIEALVFGMRWTAAHAEADMAQAAKSALAKIHKVLTPHLSAQFSAQALFPIHQPTYQPGEEETLIHIRQALRTQRKLVFDYTDSAGQSSRRTVWPLAVGYFDNTRLLAAWCELRQEFRHFRCDRICTPVTRGPYPIAHDFLLKQWQRQECLNLNAFDV